MGWFAAGPGAARFVGGRREVNHRSTTTYLRRIESGQSPVAESEPISLEQYARERAAFGIRVLAGIDLRSPQRRGRPRCRGRIVARRFKRALAEGLLIKRRVAKLRLTERGMLFADTVASRLLG